MTTRPMKPIAAFRALEAGRQDLHNAAQKFCVVGMKQDGTPRRVIVSDMAHTTTKTLEDAEQIKTRMERLNPGKLYTIITL